MVDTYSGIDLDYDQAKKDFKTGDSLFNNILVSMNIIKGSYFHAPQFGCSKPPAKIAAGFEEKFAAAIKASLKWIIDAGRARSIEVSVERDTTATGKVFVRIKALRPDNTSLNYTTFLKVI